MEWREEDQVALEWWEGLETDHDLCAFDTFSQALSEEWDCTVMVTDVIARQLVTTVEQNKEDFISKEAFYLFVRAFGPFGSGKTNPMFLLILRDFFEVDGKTSRGVFHGHVEEKKAYSTIREPGEFFYRYSSRSLDGICVVRVSKSKHANGEYARAAEILVNNREGGWVHAVKDKPSTVYSTLADYEQKNAEKVFKPVKVGAAAAPVNFYAASMTGYPGTGSSFPPTSAASSSFPGYDLRSLMDRQVSGLHGLAPVDERPNLYSALLGGGATSPPSQSRSHSSRSLAPASETPPSLYSSQYAKE